MVEAGKDGDEAAATMAAMAPAMQHAVARRLGAAERAGRHKRKSTRSKQRAYTMPGGEAGRTATPPPSPRASGRLQFLWG